MDNTLPTRTVDNNLPTRTVLPNWLTATTVEEMTQSLITEPVSDIEEPDEDEDYIPLTSNHEEDNEDDEDSKSEEDNKSEEEDNKMPGLVDIQPEEPVAVVVPIDDAATQPLQLCCSLAKRLHEFMVRVNTLHGIGARDSLFGSKFEAALEGYLNSVDQL